MSGALAKAHAHGIGVSQMPSLAVRLGLDSGSGDVRPDHSPRDLPDETLAHPKRPSDISLRESSRDKASDLQNRCGVKLRCAVSGASRATLGVRSRPVPVAKAFPISTLRVTIGGVVALGPRPEMAGVAAGRMVARMANAESFRDRAPGQLVSKSVGLAGPMDRRRELEHPVPVLVSRGRPRPAGIRSAAAVDLRPEPFFRGRLVQLHARPPSRVAVRLERSRGVRLGGARFSHYSTGGADE